MEQKKIISRINLHDYPPNLIMLSTYIVFPALISKKFFLYLMKVLVFFVSFFLSPFVVWKFILVKFFTSRVIKTASFSYLLCYLKGEMSVKECTLNPLSLIMRDLT